MTESKFAKQVIREPNGKIERDGNIIFDGIIVSPQQMGEKCQFLYSIVTKAHVNEEVAHYHDFPIILTFAGITPGNIYDFDAEIEFYLGGEKQVITTAAVVPVPAKMVHCPLIFKRVGKPLAFIEVQLTDKYIRHVVET
jgi:hypothetical protein